MAGQDQADIRRPQRATGYVSATGDVCNVTDGPRSSQTTGVASAAGAGAGVTRGSTPMPEGERSDADTATGRGEGKAREEEEEAEEPGEGEVVSGDGMFAC